jgi:PBSX family phage terminase large subunit
MERKYKATQAQKKATHIVVNSDAKNICAYGGSRSGKSFWIMRNIIIRAAKEPDSDHLIVRETFSSAKASIWQKTLPDVLTICFPFLPVKYNHSDYILTLPNNSTIKIAGLDDNKKLERLLGTEYSTIWYNESNQIPFPAVTKLKSRLAQKNNLRKLCFYDLNPTKTTSWTYQVFEQKINPTDGEALSDPDNYLSIQMNVQDNIENIDEEYIKMLESLPEKDRLRFLSGEYDPDNTGAAVYAFNDDHISEDARKLSGTIYGGADFNISNNADVLASQHAHGLYIWDEQLIAGDTFKKADGLKAKGATGASIVCDSTGKARRTTGISDHEILKQAGFNVIYKTNPAIKDKINNLNRCFTLGLIKIHPTRCKKLIRDLRQLTWKDEGKLDSGPDDSLGHLTDALAYLVWYLYPLRDISNYKITANRR